MATNTKLVKVVVVGDSTGGQQALRSLGSTAEGVEKKHSTLGKMFGKVATYAKLGLGLAAGFAVHAGIQMAIGAENARMAFTNLMGSTEKAKQHLEDLKDFAAKTPFQFQDVVQASQKLQAMGVSAENVIPYLTAIGDAAAGTGRGAEGIQRITLAVGQMLAKGKVSGEEIRQLAEAGIPALQYLADAYGVSTGEMSKMISKGLIPARKGVDILIKGMENGSKNAKGFGGLMAQQAETIGGKWSTLKDEFTMAIGDMVLALKGPIVGALDGLIWAVQNVKKLFTDYRDALYGVVGAIVAYNIASAAMTITQTIQHYGGLSEAISFLIFKIKYVIVSTKAWTVAQWALNAAHLSNPFGIVVLAIIALIGAIILAYRHSETFRKIVQAAWSGIKTAAEAVANFFVTYVWPVLKMVWEGLAVGFRWAWNIISIYIKVAITVIRTYINIWITIIKTAIKVVLWLADGVTTAFRAIQHAIGVVIAWLHDYIWPIIHWIIYNIFAIVWFLAKQGFKVAFGLISAVIRTAVVFIRDVAWPIIRVIFNAVATAAKWLYTHAIYPAWTGIRWVINAVVGFIRNFVWPVIKAAFDHIAGHVRWLYNNVMRPIWMAIQTVIKVVANYIYGWVVGRIRGAFNTMMAIVKWLRRGWDIVFNAIRDKIAGVGSSIVKTFQKTKDGIKRFWNQVIGIVKKPVNLVIDFYNNGVRAVWNFVASKINMKGLGRINKLAGGGIIPGYDPGNDIYPALLSPGEGVAVPELVRQIGAQRFMDWNRRARQGQPIQEFGIGGVIGSLVNAGKSVAKKAKDLFLGVLLKIASPLVNVAKAAINKLIPSKPPWSDAIRRSAHTILNQMLNFIKIRDVMPTGAKWTGKRVEEITRWLKLQDRKPYIWASAGPRGYDCSGIVSAVWNMVMGRSPYRHTFSTHTMGQYFKGKPGGIFTVGWSHAGQRGGGSVGHTAGVWNGMPFESGGSHGNVSVGHSNVTPLSAFMYKASLAGAEKRLGAIALESGKNLDSWISTALGILHLPASWAGRLKTLIMKESGGNPNAINRWDINARRGDPSRGLMQVIGATFNRYKLSGLSPNIYDPISNIVAGLRYIRARYKTIFNVPLTGYDSGGWLEPGVTLAYNGTGRRERVHKPDEGAGIYIDKLIVNVDRSIPKSEADRIARQIRDSLVELGRRNGGAIRLPNR